MSEPVSFETLAAYNAEVARGIVHTPEWDAQMAGLQREFDAQAEAWAEAALQQWKQPGGFFVIPPWWPRAMQDAALRIFHARRAAPSEERPSGT